MNPLQFAGFAVCAAALALILRKLRPEAATVLIIAAGAMTGLLLVPHIISIVSGVISLAKAGNVQEKYISQLLKVGGISLLMEFAAQTCRDAAEESLAARVELFGRVMLIALSLPIMRALLEQIFSLSS